MCTVTVSARGPRSQEEDYDEVTSLTWYDITLSYEDVKDILHYFLFEHLQDAAADLVESCGTDGVEMWKMINSYYEPASHATHANIHAQVYEMSRRKAKNSAEMHGLLRELEKRLTRLSSINGTIQPEAKASILYNMLDDATQKIVCDANKNGDWDYMRQKVIREGSEFRERAILKHSKTVPMDLDALGRADQDQSEPGAGGGEVNAVHNPNIICYLCKEKGHIARNCPHNTGQQGKGDQRTKGLSKGDDWWYQPYTSKSIGKGGGKKGKGHGKGGGKGGKGKGYGRTYSIENHDEWDRSDWWYESPAAPVPSAPAAAAEGGLRSLQRLCTLREIRDEVKDRKPVKEVVRDIELKEHAPKLNLKANFEGDRKCEAGCDCEAPSRPGRKKTRFQRTADFDAIIHNSKTYNNLVRALGESTPDERGTPGDEGNGEVLDKSSPPQSNRRRGKQLKENINERVSRKDPRQQKSVSEPNDPTPAKEAKDCPRLVKPDWVPLDDVDEVDELLLEYPELMKADAMDDIPLAIVARLHRQSHELAQKRKERYDTLLTALKEARTSGTSASRASVTEDAKTKSLRRQGIIEKSFISASELIKDVKEEMYQEIRDEKRVARDQKQNLGGGMDCDFLMTDDSEWVEVCYSKPKKRHLQFFKEITDGTINTIGQSEWEEIVITVDSGATETVAPLSMCKGIPIENSPGSLSGVRYEVANGGVISNKGQKNCVVQTEGGTAKLLSFQVCDVHKPLLAVSKLCEAGNAVVFHPQWSYIENLHTGERTTLHKNEGLYELRAWVRSAKGFGRQDQER